MDSRLHEDIELEKDYKFTRGCFRAIAVLVIIGFVSVAAALIYIFHLLFT